MPRPQMPGTTNTQTYNDELLAWTYDLWWVQEPKIASKYTVGQTVIARKSVEHYNFDLEKVTETTIMAVVAGKSYKVVSIAELSGVAPILYLATDYGSIAIEERWVKEYKHQRNLPEWF